DEKMFAKKVAQSLDWLKKGMPTKMELFAYDESIWRAAVHCEVAIYEGVERTSFQRLKEAKDMLPIQSRSELVVSGKELMHWANKSGGPWLKKALEKITTLVVNGQLLNDEQRIKEWFTNEWND
ncbi:MAG: CCA tRNA nucleotidyltransferase, partial [Kurthia sp.]